jgi:hypothetical protein
MEDIPDIELKYHLAYGEYAYDVCMPYGIM